MILLLFVGGLALLILGAELLVRGASRLAAAFGISPLIVGLTVVAFATSAPEMAVSVKAVLAGQDDVAIGNVVGSNIMNVLFILGLSALVTPLVVSRQLVRLDVPLMIVASFAVLGFGLNGTVARWEAAILFVALLSYLAFLVRLSLNDSDRALHMDNESTGASPGVQRGLRSYVRDITLVLIGLGMLVLGSRWLVDSAVTVATALGVSELVIGLTIIAAGTSLPEVVTSVVASIRGQRDIAVGNVLGSNLFNLLGVLGLAGIVAPNGLAVPQSALVFDIPIMIGVAIACLPIFATGFRIDRWEGGVFLAYYGAYITYVVLAATESVALPGFQTALLYFVMPLSVLTLATVAIRERRRPPVPP